MTTLISACEAFLQSVANNRAEKTALAYRADLLGGTGFVAWSKKVRGLSDISAMREEHAAQYLSDLAKSGAAITTRQRRAAAIKRFYTFVAAHNWAPVTTDRLKYLLEAGMLTANVQRHINFDEAKIQRIYEHAWLCHLSLSDVPVNLRALRNVAFLLTLAETGLRVHEACTLTRGQVDLEKGQATIIGKGDKQAAVLFGERSIAAIRQYLRVRMPLDGKTGIQLSSLPIFARHDPGTGSKIQKITPSTGERIVHEMARLALGDEYDPAITCHKYRHYFVTKILRATNNLRTAQELARHSSVTTTTLYSHLSQDELKSAHGKVFNG